MSMSGDFMPGGDYESAPNYPSAFGITFTPMVSGIGLGLLGLAAAVFAWLNVVDPLRVETETLQTSVDAKEKQLSEQKNIEKQLKETKVKLTQVEQQRQQVYSLFAQKKNMDTVLYDLNQFVEKNNVGLASAKSTKLAACPTWVKEQFTSMGSAQSFEESVGPLVAQAQLRKFLPQAEKPGSAATTSTTIPGLVTDSSLGPELNNKLRRETIDVSFEGNFSHAQSIIRRIELLQPLLILRNLEVKYGGQQVSKTEYTPLYDIKSPEIPVLVPNCQPDVVVTTSFKMDALIPLTPEEQKLVPATPTAKASPGASPSPSPAAKK